MKNVLFYLFCIAPWSMVIDKYESGGSYFFECRYLSLIRAKNRKLSSLFGYLQTITVQVGEQDFEDHDVGDEYEFTPSAMVIQSRLAVA